MADTRLIPDGIKDEVTIALNELLEERFNIDLTPLLVYKTDSVDSSVLPFLASQFHVLGNEGWKFALTEEQQRNLIENAIDLHKYKGTPYAIKKVFQILGIEAMLVEWFSVAPFLNPYYFKVYTDNLPENLDILIDLIFEYKNARSHLASITSVTGNTCADLFILDYSYPDCDILDDVEGVDYRGVKLCFYDKKNREFTFDTPLFYTARTMIKNSQCFYVYSDLLDVMVLDETRQILNYPTHHYMIFGKETNVNINPGNAYPTQTFKAQIVLDDYGTLDGGEGFIGYYEDFEGFNLDDTLLDDAISEIIPILEFFWDTKTGYGLFVTEMTEDFARSQTSTKETIINILESDYKTVFSPMITRNTQIKRDWLGKWIGNWDDGYTISCQRTNCIIENI